MKYLILSGVGSFFLLYYLGLCYEELQKYEQAAEAYRQAITLYPEFDLVKQELDNLDKKYIE